MSDSKGKRDDSFYEQDEDASSRFIKVPESEPTIVSAIVDGNLQDQLYNIQQPVLLNQYPILQNYLTDGGQQSAVFQTESDQKLVYLIVPNEGNSLNENLPLKDVQTVPTLLVLPKDIQNSSNEVQYVIQTGETTSHSNENVAVYDNSNEGSEISFVESKIGHNGSEGKAHDQLESVTDDQQQQQHVYISSTQCGKRYSTIQRENNSNSGNCYKGVGIGDLSTKKPYTYRNQYRCEYDGCDELFSSVYEKKSHAEVHLFPESTEFKCSICNATFSKAIERNKHVDGHSVAETYKCKACHKSFSYYTALVKHIDEQKCSTGKSLSCHFCGAKFLNQKDLEKHQKVNIKICVCKTKVCGESAFVSHSGTCNVYLQKKNKLKRGHIPILK